MALTRVHLLSRRWKITVEMIEKVVNISGNVVRLIAIYLGKLGEVSPFPIGVKR